MLKRSSAKIYGKETFSNVKSVLYVEETALMKVGPYSFSNSITLSNLIHIKRIDLVDLKGRIVVSRMVKNDHTVILETSELPPVMYQLKSNKKDGSFTSIKVIKL